MIPITKLRFLSVESIARMIEKRRQTKKIGFLTAVAYFTEEIETQWPGSVLIQIVWN